MTPLIDWCCTLLPGVMSIHRWCTCHTISCNVLTVRTGQSTPQKIIPSRLPSTACVRIQMNNFDSKYASDVRKVGLGRRRRPTHIKCAVDLESCVRVQDPTSLMFPHDQSAVFTANMETHDVVCYARSVTAQAVFNSIRPSKVAPIS